jgi:hypothetical protein
VGILLRFGVFGSIALEIGRSTVGSWKSSVRCRSTAPALPFSSTPSISATKWCAHAGSRTPYYQYFRGEEFFRNTLPLKRKAGQFAIHAKALPGNP